MGSAESVVQELGYVASFPLLLNINGEPTYFIPLKGQDNLVKMYAMVNVAQYQVVATGNTVSQCEQEYIRLLGSSGIVQEEDLPQTQASGVIADIRSAVLDGTTYYFIRLEGKQVYYSLSAAENPVAVLLNVGDAVTIQHNAPAEGENSSILGGTTVTLDEAAAPTPESSAPAASPQPTPAEE